MKNNSSVGTRYYASGNTFVVATIAKTTPFELGGSRGAISKFSDASGVRMRRYLRGCLAEYTGMLTLTYPFCYPSNGRAVKEHLRRFIQEVRREYARQHGNDYAYGKFSAFWFLEFQDRGAPHFHIFTTWNPSKEWVSKKWYEICNTEDERHLRAGTRTELLRSGRRGTMAYASKYAAKLAQKSVPEGYENVGRFWGVTGVRAVLAADTYVTQDELKDEWIQKDVKRMMLDISNAVQVGKAEVVVRKQGVLVVVMHDPGLQRKMRSNVSRLSAKTMHWSMMFQDAELEI